MIEKQEIKGSLDLEPHFGPQKQKRVFQEGEGEGV